MSNDDCQRIAERYVGVPEGFVFRPGVVEAICHSNADLSHWSPAQVEQLVGLTDHDQDEIVRFASLLRALGPTPTTAATRAPEEEETRG